MNLNRIKTLVETHSASDLQAKLSELEACFIPDTPAPLHICRDAAALEIDLGDYAKALVIRLQVEDQGVSFQDALRDLARRMRSLSASSV